MNRKRMRSHNYTQVARLLKRLAGAVTLAIGDGANDVSMIQVCGGLSNLNNKPLNII